jgi:hypothetical protein
MMLVVGSVYRVTSIGTKDKPIVSEGVFKGYLALGGNADAICLELGKLHKQLAGKLRFIPTHVILTIDVLESIEREDEEEREKTERYYA